MIVCDKRRPQQNYQQRSGRQYTRHDQPPPARVDNSLIRVAKALTPVKSIQVPRVNYSPNRCNGQLSRQCAIDTLQFQWRVTTGFDQRTDEKLNREEGKEPIKNQLGRRRPTEGQTQNAHRDKHSYTSEHAGGDSDQKNSKNGSRCG